LISRFIAWLDGHTRIHRIKDAESIFYLGSPRPVSRLWSNAYFSLAAALWGRRAQDPSHLAVFAAGLEACRPARRVLDVGTGGGGTAALVAERWPESEVTAIDLSRRMLRVARSNHPHANIDFVRSPSHVTSFADSYFDLVVFLNAVANPIEIARVTTADAEILVASFWPANTSDGAWVGRWRDAGFERVREYDEERGSWELYRKVGAPRT
jgi:SAM-dependent methyltransferase